MEIILVRCSDMKILISCIAALTRELKYSNINHRINYRKKELVVLNTKFRFVTQNQNIVGIRFDKWIFSHDIPNKMIEIIKGRIDKNEG